MNWTPGRNEMAAAWFLLLWSDRHPQHQNRSIYWCCNAVLFLYCVTS